MVRMEVDGVMGDNKKLKFKDKPISKIWNDKIVKVYYEDIE